MLGISKHKNALMHMNPGCPKTSINLPKIIKMEGQLKSLHFMYKPSFNAEQITGYFYSANLFMIIGIFSIYKE